MDTKKVEIKNIGNKLAEEHEGNSNKDMSKELEKLDKININNEPQAVITIKEHDIQTLKNEFDITYEEAKNKLIKCQGDVNKAFEKFLNDFNLE